MKLVAEGYGVTLEVRLSALSFPEHILETHWGISFIISVSVYYVAVCTIVLSRHGSNLARPVIIHGLICDPIWQNETEVAF